MSGVAFKHALSGDNPEADWGRHVKQAAEFALSALDRAFPQARPFTFDNTRVIAVGISNGGGAVLRAAELEGGWLDAVVAGEPNIYLPAPGSRTLYDYTTEAALLMPCALLHLPADSLPQPPIARPGRAVVDRALRRVEGRRPGQWRRCRRAGEIRLRPVACQGLDRPVAGLRARSASASTCGARWR